MAKVTVLFERESMYYSNQHLAFFLILPTAYFRMKGYKIYIEYLLLIGY
jgi:hypothetical protein